jgi:hypothetical protein
MAANAYYVTGTYTCAQVRTPGTSDPRGGTIEVFDSFWDAIVFANSSEEAHELFGTALCEPQEGEGENPREVTVRKIAVAPIVDRLLTESGDVPLTWAKILEQSNSLVESTPADDFEQGYWVDVDAVVPSDKISFSVGTLESNVPEDVRSGLNWSSNKQFYFLLKVLPLPLPPRPAYEIETEAGVGDEDVDAGNEPDPSEEPGIGGIDVVKATWPEIVAVIQARNSVAAAWLWRRYAANTQTPWTNNAIQITPMCTTIGEVSG